MDWNHPVLRMQMEQAAVNTDPHQPPGFPPTELRAHNPGGGPVSRLLQRAYVGRWKVAATAGAIAAAAAMWLHADAIVSTGIGRDDTPVSVQETAEDASSAAAVPKDLPPPEDAREDPRNPMRDEARVPSPSGPAKSTRLVHALKQVEHSLGNVEERVAEMLGEKDVEFVVDPDETGFWREGGGDVQHFIVVNVQSDGTPAEWTTDDMDAGEPRTASRWAILVDEETFSKIAAEKAIHGSIAEPVIGRRRDGKVEWDAGFGGPVLSGWEGE